VLRPDLANLSKKNRRCSAMRLNHVANRLDPRHFETVVEMLKVKLSFIELGRTERAILGCGLCFR
jgi:hypothetical protein